MNFIIKIIVKDLKATMSPKITTTQLTVDNDNNLILSIDDYDRFVFYKNSQGYDYKSSSLSLVQDPYVMKGDFLDCIFRIDKEQRSLYVGHNNTVITSVLAFGVPQKTYELVVNSEKYFITINKSPNSRLFNDVYEHDVEVKVVNKNKIVYHAIVKELYENMGTMKFLKSDIFINDNNMFDSYNCYLSITSDNMLVSFYRNNITLYKDQQKCKIYSDDIVYFPVKREYINFNLNDVEFGKVNNNIDDNGDPVKTYSDNTIIRISSTAVSLLGVFEYSFKDGKVYNN